MSETLTPSVQDYLKAIYALTGEGGEAATTALAERLGVAPASVTGMLQKLAGLAPPLVTYQKHQGARLTPEGERAALEVLRHHRLLEAYLVESLGYSWDAVHEEACRLEHVISEEFEARIDERLGHPQRDPHGAPIPSADLVMPPDVSIPLADLRPDERAIVRRIGNEDPDLLRQLGDLGLFPGAELVVRARSGGESTVELGGGETMVIAPAISSQVFVETLPGEDFWISS